MIVAPGVLIGLLVAGVGLNGRQIGYLWSFEELAAKADTIVIAEHVRTVDARRGIEHPELKPGTPVVEMESVFNVLTVLKEGAERETKGATQLRLKHYRVDWDEFRRRHGPLVRLVNAGSSLDFTKEKGPYLLFLERVEGEGHQPLSGHTFPTDSGYLLRKLTR